MILLEKRHHLISKVLKKKAQRITSQGAKQADKRKKLALNKVPEYSKTLREKWVVSLCLCYYINRIFYMPYDLWMELSFSEFSA